MSSDAEFESTQSTCVAHSPSSKRRKTDLRPLPKNTKISALFAPGACLDSQTTDSQWAEINFGQSETQASKFPSSEPEGDALGDGPGGYSQILDDTEGLPTDTPQDGKIPCDNYLLGRVIEIIDLCTDNAIQNLDLPKKDMEIQELRKYCLVLEGQVSSLIARNQVLCREMAQEREWIHLLEQKLQAHQIPYPPYPVT